MIYYCTQVSLLPSRWRLCNHPLYELACKRLQLSTKASPVDQVSASDQPVELVPDNIALEAYNKVFYPSKSDIRYNSLMQDCKQVVAFAQDNPHLYRRFKMMLSQFLTSANDRDQRAGHAPRTAAANRIHDNAVIRAPITKAKKRGRTSSNDDRNLSALNICKQGKHSNKACSLCRKYGVEATDHRRGSRCPFYNKSDE